MPEGSQGLGYPEQVGPRGQEAGGAQVSLCPQELSQPDLGMGWCGHGVVKAGGSEHVPIRMEGGQDHPAGHSAFQGSIHLALTPMYE